MHPKEFHGKPWQSRPRPADQTELNLPRRVVERGVTRTRRTLAACGLALLVMTACSGDDDKAASTTTVPTASTATTVRPVDTSFTGEGSTQFCALARTFNDRSASVGSNPTPAQLRTVAREGQTAINQAVNAAPAEIKKDVEVIAGGFTVFLGELEKVNFDASKLPPSAVQSISSPDFQQATTRFQAYFRSVCRG